MPDIRIKRGGTLSLNLAFTNADGTAFSLTNVALSAQVRDAEFNLVAALVPAPGTTAGQANILVQDTSSWPEGLLRMDVLVQPAGGPQSLSQTIGIYVDRSVTQLEPEQGPFNPVTS